MIFYIVIFLTYRLQFYKHNSSTSLFFLLPSNVD